MSLSLVPSASTLVVRSPRRPALRRQAVRRRACEVNRDLFDPFDLVNGDLTASEASRARTAIAACESCPFLKQCKTDTVTALTGDGATGYNLHPPTSVVQAAVLWDDDSQPYTPPSVEASDDMLPLEFFSTAPIVNASWTPPAPVRRLNEIAINAALSQDALHRTVTAHYLVREKIAEDPTRMVLARDEELEVIRRGLASGYTVYQLAVNLRTSWRRVDRTRVKYGFDILAES